MGGVSETAVAHRACREFIERRNGFRREPAELADGAVPAVVEQFVPEPVFERRQRFIAFEAGGAAVDFAGHDVSVLKPVELDVVAFAGELNEVLERVGQRHGPFLCMQDERGHDGEGCVDDDAERAETHACGLEKLSVLGGGRGDDLPGW